MTRIVLIHATRVAMVPVEAAFTALWPQAETVSLLDESLSADLASGRASQEELDGRICALADHADGLGLDAILYTCSSFGTGIEAAARTRRIPVLKPNEAMFEAAAATGGRIVMLYSFTPAAVGMEREFREIAEASGATLRPVPVPGALNALKAGDGAAHDRLVSEAARQVQNADALMLAHFSMTRAAEAVRAATPLPVFTAPETAVAKLRMMVTAHTGAGGC